MILECLTKPLQPLYRGGILADGETDFGGRVVGGCWSCCCCPIRRARAAAKRGEPLSGPNPTDRAKAGAKRHVVVDRQGIPLAVRLTAANGHDGPVFEPLLDAT